MMHIRLYILASFILILPLIVTSSVVADPPGPDQVTIYIEITNEVLNVEILMIGASKYNYLDITGNNASGEKIYPCDYGDLRKSFPGQGYPSAKLQFNDKDQWQHEFNCPGMSEIESTLELSIPGIGVKAIFDKLPDGKRIKGESISY